MPMMRDLDHLPNGFGMARSLPNSHNGLSDHQSHKVGPEKTVISIGVVGPLPSGLFMAYKWRFLTTY